jgi:hypothetical protein
VFLIPMLYVVFQWLRERVSRGPTAATAPVPPGEVPTPRGAPAE